MVFLTQGGPCCQTTLGEMLGCRLEVQVPVALLGAWSSVAGLISSITSALFSRTSPGWKCQRRAEGKAHPAQPHPDEPRGAYGSYQHPYTCTAATMGGRGRVSVWWELGGRRPDGQTAESLVEKGAPYWFVQLLDVWRSKETQNRPDSLRLVESVRLCPYLLLNWIFYSQLRLTTVLLDKRSGQQPPPISGPISCSVCLCCWS